MELWQDEWFNRLYNENFDRVKRTILRMVHNHDVADELVHETFLNLLMNERKLIEQEHPNIPAWLIETARLLALNEVRRSRRRKEILFIEEAIEDVMEQEERLDDVLPNDMPAMERQVLIWYYEYRFDIRMITQRMGIPEVTVRSKLYRARQRYKNFLEKNENGATKQEAAYINR